MDLYCLTDLYHQGKRYKEGDSIKLDQQKIEAFISKGWVAEKKDEVAEIEVVVKEVKAKRQTKELKVDAETKDDETNKD